VASVDDHLRERGVDAAVDEPEALADALGVWRLAGRGSFADLEESEPEDAVERPWAGDGVLVEDVGHPERVAVRGRSSAIVDAHGFELGPRQCLMGEQ
jgi:hypothetical protein